MSLAGFERCAGKLAAFTSIGSYPLIYLTREGNCLCAACADEALSDPEEYDPPVSSDVLWEGPPTSCDECGLEIESAYGDPDEEKRAEISAGGAS